MSEFERPDRTVLTTSDAWETDIENQGHDPAGQSLDVETIKPPGDIAKRLNLNPETDTCVVRRHIRYIDGKPAIIFPGKTSAPIKGSDQTRHLLRRAFVKPRRHHGTDTYIMGVMTWLVSAGSAGSRLGDLGKLVLGLAALAGLLVVLLLVWFAIGRFGYWLDDHHIWGWLMFATIPITVITWVIFGGIGIGVGLAWVGVLIVLAVAAHSVGR